MPKETEDTGENLCIISPRDVNWIFGFELSPRRRLRANSFDLCCWFFPFFSFFCGKKLLFFFFFDDLSELISRLCGNRVLSLSIGIVRWRSSFNSFCERREIFGILKINKFSKLILKINPINLFFFHHLTRQNFSIKIESLETEATSPGDNNLIRLASLFSCLVPETGWALSIYPRGIRLTAINVGRGFR